MSAAPQAGHDAPALKLVRPDRGREVVIDVAMPGTLRLRLWRAHEWAVLSPTHKPDAFIEADGIYVAIIQPPLR